MNLKIKKMMFDKLCINNLIESNKYILNYYNYCNYYNYNMTEKNNILNTLNIIFIFILKIIY